MDDHTHLVGKKGHGENKSLLDKGRQPEEGEAILHQMKHINRLIQDVKLISFDSCRYRER
jgi:hypothetical protein